jgi:NAD+ synthase
MKIVLAQARLRAGDIQAQAAFAAALIKARAGAAELVVFPELFLAGGPCGAVMTDRGFMGAARAALDDLARATANGVALAIGLPLIHAGKTHNAIAVCAEGRIAGFRLKARLTDRGMLDERDLFAAGPLPGPVAIGGRRIGFAIGDDIDSADVIECLADTGAEAIIHVTARPFATGDQERRVAQAVARAVENRLPVASLNGFGASADLLFDGASFAVDRHGALTLQARRHGEAMIATTLQADGFRSADPPAVLREGADAARETRNVFPMALMDAERIHGTTRFSPPLAFNAGVAKPDYKPDEALLPDAAMNSTDAIDA